jgi:hypothetical protein
MQLKSRTCDVLLAVVTSFSKLRTVQAAWLLTLTAVQLSSFQLTLQPAFMHRSRLLVFSRPGLVNMQLQDDIAIISSCTGWAPPTAGATAANATMLLGVTSGFLTTATVHGLVGGQATRLVYALNASAGLLTVLLDGIPSWADGWGQTNLDLQLTVSDSLGNILANTNRATTLGIPTTNLVLQTDGAYHITVAGTGLEGSYSSYGSMGQFTMTVEWPTATVGEPGIGYRWVCYCNVSESWSCNYCVCCPLGSGCHHHLNNHLQHCLTGAVPVDRATHQFCLLPLILHVVACNAPPDLPSPSPSP